MEELKASLEFNNSLIEVLKQDNASLKTEVNNLKWLTADLWEEDAKMASDTLDIQCRSMRDNVIIHGIPGEAKERWSDWAAC